MIRVIEGLPEGDFGVEAEGEISRDEVDGAMTQFAARVQETYDQKLLLDYTAAPCFSEEASRDSFDNRVLARGPVRRVALVGGARLKEKFEGFVAHVGCEAKVFPEGHRDAALAWLIE